VIQVHLAKPLSHSADEVAGMFTIAEKVQRRLIKMLPEFKDIKYEDALKKLKLNTVEERRNQAGLIFLYKMYKGLTQPPFELMFQLTCFGQTRGHTLK